MINIKKLVENKEKAIISYKNRNIDLEKDIEKVSILYKEYVKMLSEENDIRALLNEETRKIANDPKHEKQTATNLSNKAKKIKKLIEKHEVEINNIISFFPNLPSDDVIIGKDENDNKVIETFGEILSENKIPHWEIMEKKNMILQKEASTISGARHVIYNNKTVDLIKAIEKLMLSTHEKSGYTVIEPPVIVNENALYNTAQLPKFKEDLFMLTNGQYLIPTAEVPLTNIAAGKIYKEEELPIKLTASTSCFRSEAGSAGRDTRGIIRLHQFRKVELVKFGKRENENEDFNEMLLQASKILDLLKLPYRHLLLCTGDMGFSSRKTIDIEVWMPGQNRWVEISSVSSIGDFQSRRMKSRVKLNNKDKELIYTYNGSALAIGRTLAAIIENYYSEEDNTIRIPEVLHKYLDFEKI